MWEGMIQYLGQEEKKRTRALYEANFPEDSPKFVDYYYTYKTRDNRILAMEEAGQLQAVLHLNPFAFQICGSPTQIHYVVAVATDPSVRGQGKMKAVMKAALEDMAKAHQPFTFLIPVNPRVYASSGFVLVPSECYRRQGNGAGDGLPKPEPAVHGGAVAPCLHMEDFPGVSLRRAEHSDIPAMVRFAEELLEREYDIFPRHTAAYYERIMAEMESENGAVMLAEVEPAAGQKPMTEQDGQSGTNGDNGQSGMHGEPGRLAGIFTYGQEEAQAELQEILVEPKWQSSFFSQIKDWFLAGQGSLPELLDMRFMVRILDLKALVPMLCCEAPFSLKVRVRDSILPENEGCYQIRMDSRGGSIRVLPEDEAEQTMDISGLTELLFGKWRLFVREWV